MQSYDVTIVGGCGRVGLPLGLAFADRGLQVALYDIRPDAVDAVNAGEMPFVEPGAPAAARVGARGRAARRHPRPRRGAPGRARGRRDRHPDRRAPQPRPRCGARGHRGDRRLPLRRAAARAAHRPCTRASPPRWNGWSARLGLDVDVAFCPERIAEGKALEELAELPQIVAARTDACAGARHRNCSAT